MAQLSAEDLFFKHSNPYTTHTILPMKTNCTLFIARRECNEVVIYKTSTNLARTVDNTKRTASPIIDGKATVADEGPVKLGTKPNM